ncbi:MAG: hypothetical protein E7396_05990 [Ruminococcaceae bacterium]|nr:hypothetical protein [Oscillospiraceae bacterium]
MTEIMRDFLKTNKKNVVTIFSDKYNPEKCTVGYVQMSDCKGTILSAISPEGLYDGCVWRADSLIYRIDIEGKYERYLKEKNKAMAQRIASVEIYGDSLKTILKYAYKSKSIVDISIDESGMQELVKGHIETIHEDGTLVIKRTNQFEEDDGYCIIEQCDIVSLNCQA